MTSNIVAFESAGFQLPAFLQNSEGSNSDLTAHQSQSFPVLSIKGKVFSIVRGTERQIVPNPKDPESPATRLPMIIVKANKNKAKSYFASSFKEGVEDVKPTCFSNDGIRPDPQAEHPQCTSCAKCKWNAFGTARGDNGAGKGKACADTVRVAVVPATGPFTEAYLLRVPPASIKALGEFGSFCEKRKIPHQAVVCELSFDQEQATPRLVFTPKGIVGDQATYNQIMELAKSDEVQMIIGAVSANDLPRYCYTLSGSVDHFSVIVIKINVLTEVCIQLHREIYFTVFLGNRYLIYQHSQMRIADTSVCNDMIEEV